MKPDKDTKYYNITCSCGAHVMCIQFSRFSYPELFFAFLTIDGMKKDKSFFSRIKDCWKLFKGTYLLDSICITEKSELDQLVDSVLEIRKEWDEYEKLTYYTNEMYSSLDDIYEDEEYEYKDEIYRRLANGTN
jgi:hypothetical protein